MNKFSNDGGGLTQEGGGPGNKKITNGWDGLESLEVGGSPTVW